MMRTWLIMLAVGIVAVAGYLLTQPHMSASSSGSDAAEEVAKSERTTEAASRVGQAEGQPTFRQLAMRLLSTGTAQDSAQVEVDVGQIPDWLAEVVPLPEQAKVIGTYVRRANPDSTPPATHQAQASVVLDVPMPSEAVSEFYGQRLPDRGWDRHQRGPPQRSGFVPSLSNEGQTFCETDGSAYLRINAYERDAAPTDVRVSWHEGEVYSPCDEPDVRAGGMDREPIPSLVAPQGSRTTGAGGGGGSDRKTTRVTLITDLDVSALLKHYESQLMDADWRKLSNNSSGPLAWSSWQLQDDQGQPWRGLLFGINLPGESATRHVYLRVDRME